MHADMLCRSAAATKKRYMNCFVKKKRKGKCIKPLHLESTTSSITPDTLANILFVTV